MPENSCTVKMSPSLFKKKISSVLCSPCAVPSLEQFTRYHSWFFIPWTIFFYFSLTLFSFLWRSKIRWTRPRRIFARTCHSWKWTKSMWKPCPLKVWAHLKFWRSSRNTALWVWFLAKTCCLLLQHGWHRLRIVHLWHLQVQEGHSLFQRLNFIFKKLYLWIHPSIKQTNLRDSRNWLFGL